MDTALAVAIVAAITSVITTAMNIVSTNVQKRQLKRNERIMEKENEMSQTLEEISAIKAALMFVMLHILETACRECIKKNYRTMRDTEVINKMRVSYKALGGDGYADELYAAFLELEVKIK